MQEAYQDIVITELGKRDLNNAILLWLGVAVFQSRQLVYMLIEHARFHFEARKNTMSSPIAGKSP
jgi:hypothetical protein